MGKPENVTLDNLGGGAAIELFQRELNAVMKNILDVNTSEKAKRSVTLKVDIKPSEDRGMGMIEISCRSTLAPVKGFNTRVFIGQDRDGIKVFEHDPRQPGLPFTDQDLEEKVAPVGNGTVHSLHGGK